MTLHSMSRMRENDECPFKAFACPIPGIDAVAANTHHSFSRHTHDQFGIGLVLSGGQKSSSGRGPVEAASGDIITVNPGEVHDGVPLGDAPRAWRMLYFDPDLIAPAALDLSKGRSADYAFVRPVFRNPAASSLFRKLFQWLTLPDAFQRQERYNEILLMLLAGLGRQRANATSFQLRAIARAKDLIDSDPSAPISLSDMANACGLSRYQVVRGFGKTLGLTPHAYLVQRRIDKARRLIADGVPLSQAAALSGFADQSHMTRIFTRKYGLSPGAYARVKP